MKTKIKVTNTKLGVCTFWSIVKFEDKLMQMRDLYQVRITFKGRQLLHTVFKYMYCMHLFFQSLIRFDFCMCFRMMPTALVMMSYSMIPVINGSRISPALQGDHQKGELEVKCS